LAFSSPIKQKRLSALFKDFVGAFIVAKSLSSKELANTINRHLSKSKNIRLKKVIYLPYPKKLPQVLEKIIRVNQRFDPRLSALIVMMGAGDIYRYTDLLIL
jgi:hypothetical protein